MIALSTSTLDDRLTPVIVIQRRSKLITVSYNNCLGLDSVTQSHPSYKKINLSRATRNINTHAVRSLTACVRCQVNCVLLCRPVEGRRSIIAVTTGTIDAVRSLTAWVRCQVNCLLLCRPVEGRRSIIAVTTGAIDAVH